MITKLLTVFICLILLYFYEGARLAFLYSFKYRDQEKKPDNLVERTIQNLYKMPGLYLASTHLVTTALLFVIVYVEFQLLSECSFTGIAWADDILIIVVILITYGLICFLLPIVTFGKAPDSGLRIVSIPIYIIGLVLFPLTRAMLYVPKMILRIKHIDLNDKQLVHLLAGRELMNSNLRPTLSIQQPDIRESEEKILQNALEFSNVKVKDCIVPRTEIVAVELDDSVEDLMQLFVKSGKTKIIVYKEDLDHIVGYVHSSDMFKSSLRRNWTEHILKIPVVPESMSTLKMMHIFMQNKKTIAVVVDEFGGTSGIISLEDLVEEIFGDIEDEHDVVNYISRQTDEHEYLLSARLEIEKVNEQFGLDLPKSDDYLTIGGLILFHYQNFPKEGQTVNIGSFSFTIMKTTTSKIILVKLKVMS